jgi:hypothetical protein
MNIMGLLLYLAILDFWHFLIIPTEFSVYFVFFTFIMANPNNSRDSSRDRRVKQLSIINITKTGLLSRCRARAGLALKTLERPLGAVEALQIRQGLTKRESVKRDYRGAQPGLDDAIDPGICINIQMSEEDDSALSRVSISTGVIPFPSMDSSLLPQTLSALEESSIPSPGKLTLSPAWAHKFGHRKG